MGHKFSFLVCLALQEIPDLQNLGKALQKYAKNESATSLLNKMIFGSHFSKMTALGSPKAHKNATRHRKRTFETELKHMSNMLPCWSLKRITSAQELGSRVQLHRLPGSTSPLMA